MDCSAEERLIRLRLESLTAIRNLRFDIPARKLEVFHTGSSAEISAGLEQLRLGAVQVADEENLADDAGRETGKGEDFRDRPQREAGPLIAALCINAALFLGESVAGLLAYSLGLVADSLDMLADALVYAMALAAVGGSVSRQKSIAAATGYLQGFLAVAGLLEVLRRFFFGAGTPDFLVMILVSCIALAGNIAVLLILNRTKDAGAHMRAAWIFTSVDVQVNALVIGSGILIALTGSRIPDLAAGGLVFLLVANAARRILALGT